MMSFSEASVAGAPSSPHTLEEEVRALFRHTLAGVVLLLLVFGGFGAYGYWQHDRLKRSEALVQEIAALQHETQRHAEAWLRDLLENPLVRNGVRWLARFRRDSNDAAFFEPLAQELSLPLALAARELPANSALRLSWEGIVAIVRPDAVWWRHEGIPAVYRFELSQALRRYPEDLPPAIDNWVANASGWHFSGHWNWHARVQWADLPVAAEVVWVLPWERVEALVHRHGWQIQRQVQSPSTHARWISNEVGVIPGQMLVLRDAAGQALGFALTDSHPLWPLLMAELGFALTAAGVMAFWLHRALRQRLQDKLVDPVDRLVQASLRLPQDDAALAQLPVQHWPQPLPRLVETWDRVWQQTRAMEQENRFLATALRHSADAVVVTDASGAIQYLNPAAERLYGVTLHEVRGTKPGQWWGGRMAPQHYQLMWQTLEAGGPFSGLFRNRGAGGREIEVEETITPLSDASGKIVGYVSVGHEITEVRQLLQQLEAAQFQDALTGLANRYGLLQRLRGWMDVADAAIALYVLDIAGFSAFNQRFGAQQGDELLKALANRLQQWQGQTQAKAGGQVRIALARLWADQFAVAIQGDMTGGQELLLAQALREEVRALLAGGASGLDVCIGVALVPLDAQEAERLLECAEWAVQAAKSRGGGEIQWYDAKRAEAEERRLELLQRLRQAHEQCEWQLYLQPIVTDKGVLLGAEALLRWVPPNQPPVSPAEFIPLLEESGLILEVGRWVFEEALRQAEDLRSEERPDLYLAVNVSPRQWEDEHFVPWVLAKVADWRQRHGEQTFPLVLELTESGIMSNYEKIKESITRLAQAGLSIALDDFGTGLSSLARLRELPLAKLKIDRAFVMHVKTDERDAQVCGAIILMAHALGLKVVAEGVEAAEIVAALAQMQCDAFQGYYFSRPLPLPQFREWALAHRAEA